MSEQNSENLANAAESSTSTVTASDPATEALHLQEEAGEQKADAPGTDDNGDGLKGGEVGPTTYGDSLGL